MTDYVLDLDGTLYYQSTPIDGAVGAVARLRADGHRVVFTTNDATLTRAQRARALSSMGFPATENDVITSGFAAAHTVASHADAPRTAMVLGPEAIAAELRAACPALELVQPETGARVDAVVVGLDQQLSYDRLRSAHTAIRRGARFIATNADSAYPASETETAPGAGALVAALERSTGARASVVGKPNPFMLVLAARCLGVEPASLLVVGDSTSDLDAAARCGARSVLVLTGMTEAADIAPGQTSVLKSIAELPGVADAWADAMSRAAPGERPDGRPMSGENA